MFLVPVMGKKLYVLSVLPNLVNGSMSVPSMAFGCCFEYCVECKAGGLAWQ